MKKILFMITALLLAICLFAACGRPADDAQTAPDGGSDSQSAPVQDGSKEEESPAEPPVQTLTQEELWEKAAGYWLAENEDGTIEYAYIGTKGNDYIVGTGLFLSDMFVEGKSVSFTAVSDTDYTTMVRFEFGAMMTESGNIEYQDDEVELDISQLDAGTLPDPADGDSDGDPTADPDGAESAAADRLPATGADATTLAIVGVALGAAGAVVMVATRRRPA